MSEKNMSENKTESKSGLLSKFLTMPNDSMTKTIIVTVGLCFVCAILVSGAAVSLKPKQDINRLNDLRANILDVAGLDDESISADVRFESIESKIVDIATGEYVEGIDPLAYDQRAAARDPESSTLLNKEDDIASIKRRAKNAKVFLVNDENGALSRVVLPIHGYGLWGTLYGFISLESDLDTIYRIKFYDHKETPGLGGEVDNPNWRKNWQGKELFADNGDYNFTVVKGAVVQGTDKTIHEVDGLGGATLTNRGVDNLVRYWIKSFKPYLDKLQQQAPSQASIEAVNTKQTNQQG